MVAAGAALPLPAAAQIFGGRSAFVERPRAELVQFRDFFRFPFGDDRDRGFGTYSPFNAPNPFNRPRPVQPAEATKPPQPRKVETQPSSIVVVIGDTFADWLGFGLEQTLADTPDIGVVRKIRPGSGLVRYDVRPDAPDWSQAVKDMLATEKPSAIVIMLGVNDRLPLRERGAASNKAGPPGQGTEKATPGNQGTANAAPAPNASPVDSEQPAAAEPPHRPPAGNYEFRTDIWAELYEKRIDDMIAAAKSKGVPVFWVGLPAIRGARSTSDMNYLDELYRARAEKAGITYVDIWDGFVDEKGQFVMQGPDFQGQIRRLRTYDGVNFTNVGADKLAHYVEHELRRVLTAPVVPVALPGPEEQAPAKGNAPPKIGPVVPLNAAAGGQRGELLGATDHPAQHDSDPVATQVLNHGDAIAAPPGRADNFSWPRADAGAADVAAPSPPPKTQGSEIAPKNDGKKSAETKNQSAPSAAPAKTRAPRQAPENGQ